MDVSEITRLPPASLGEAPTAVPALAPGPAAPGPAAPRPAGPVDGESHAPPPYLQCDECCAPVDPDQRYCVTCGAHRRHVNDPAARYLSQAGGRSRGARAAGTPRTPRSGGPSRGLGTALVLALIPVVAAVGVLAGRSSNNSDAKLIQELANRQAAVVTSAAATPTTASAAGTPAGAKAAGHTKTKKSKRSGKSTSSTKNAGKVISTTSNGSVTQLAGSKPTQAQEQQGAAATQQVQKSTGKSYVNGQSNLPGTVVVP
jgi:hypothetical protein